MRQTRIPHRYVPLDSLDHRQALERLLRAHDEPVQWVGNLYQFVLRQAMAEAGVPGHARRLRCGRRQPRIRLCL